MQRTASKQAKPLSFEHPKQRSKLGNHRPPIISAECPCGAARCHHAPLCLAKLLRARRCSGGGDAMQCSLTRFPLGSACSLQVLDVEFKERIGDRGVLEESAYAKKGNHSLFVFISPCSAPIFRGADARTCKDRSDRVSPPEGTELARRLRRSLVGEYTWHSETAYKRTASAWLALPTSSGTIDSFT